MKNLELRAVEGTPAVTEVFLRTYQRSLLIGLEQEGVIQAEEMEECLLQLERLQRPVSGKTRNQSARCEEVGE